jgi:beta-lactamase regulating signal transducer with metallopeptidase domain
VKFVAYFILCLHWFNPLVWLAFLLMNADMEMSCDERVLKGLGGGAEIKKNYSSALLSLATGQRLIGGSPLAFIDGDVSSRVKNILNIRKQSYLVFVMSMVLVVMLSVGFSVNRVSTYIINYHVVSQEVAQADYLYFVSCCYY